ncbi:unnamed protein product [Bemisia tabaci]|uniref:ATP-grasp domain-containing protein n=1 Tax=Bemisia tabaci TaxID=7038 RepID=A0A9P0A132_BEMTA|nr:unnamed protein product [Bemisia tabaci]
MASEKAVQSSFVDLATSKMLSCTENISLSLQRFQSRLQENLEPSFSDLRDERGVIRTMAKFESYFEDIQATLRQERDGLISQLGYIEQANLNQLCEDKNLKTMPDYDQKQGVDRDKNLRAKTLQSSFSHGELPHIKPKIRGSAIDNPGALTHCSGKLSSEESKDPKKTLGDDMHSVNRETNSNFSNVTSSSDDVINVAVVDDGVSREYELKLASNFDPENAPRHDMHFVNHVKNPFSDVTSSSDDVTNIVITGGGVGNEHELGLASNFDPENAPGDDMHSVNRVQNLNFSDVTSLSDDVINIVTIGGGVNSEHEHGLASNFDPENAPGDDMHSVNLVQNLNFSDVTSLSDDVINIVIIGGGISSEHELGLASAAAAASALDPTRYKVTEITLLRDGSWSKTTNGQPLSFLEAAEIMASQDVVFPLAYGRGTEDGPLATLTTLLNVPFVGSPIVAAVTALNKWLTKLAAVDCGLAVTPGVLLGRHDDVEAAVVGPPPWFVKPVNGGSSIGVSRVDDVRDLDAALEAAFAVDDRVLVEEAVVGREVSVAVLERGSGDRLVGPPLEVLTDAGFFDTAAKYNGGSRLVVPAPLDAGVTSALEAAALAMFERVGCAGVARFDFFVTPDGGVVLNEMETLPSLRARSMVAQIFEEAGIGVKIPLNPLELSENV